MGLLAGLTIPVWAILDKSRWPQAIRSLIMFGIGAASFWVIYAVLSGLTIFEILDTIFGFHFVVTNRPYWPWIIQHPIDMFLFVGFPLSVLMLWRVGAVTHGEGTGAPAGPFPGSGAFYSFSPPPTSPCPAAHRGAVAAFPPGR